MGDKLHQLCMKNDDSGSGDVNNGDVGQDGVYNNLGVPIPLFFI
jgi:hypothetical protein